MRKCENIDKNYLLFEIYITMKIQKLLGASLLAGALAFNPLSSQKVSAQYPQLNFARDFIIAYESGIVKEIKNIPSEVRTLSGREGIEDLITIPESMIILKR